MIILKSEITSVSQFKIVLHYHCKDMFESKNFTSNFKNDDNEWWFCLNISHIKMISNNKDRYLVLTTLYVNHFCCKLNK